MWNPAFTVPINPGHYLILQQTNDHKKYRFVKYWNGFVWSNLDTVRYGEVTHWMDIPEFP
jgi:hypothetical protein